MHANASVVVGTESQSVIDTREPGPGSCPPSVVASDVSAIDIREWGFQMEPTKGGSQESVSDAYGITGSPKAACQEDRPIPGVHLVAKGEELLVRHLKSVAPPIRNGNRVLSP